MELLKQRITNYWAERADGFEKQRLGELNSDKKEKWKTELHRYLPEQKSLRVLDIGTGAGFFACILAEEGHEVTGIDLTPKMIEHAEHLSKRLGLPADFRVMDAENPEFETESFDVLVTRNLTWTLPHLGEAYRQWYRILKPNGVLINCDADYYREMSAEVSKPLPAKHAHMLIPDAMKKENDAITREIGRFQNPRPDWDLSLLKEAGFRKVIVDREVFRRIYAEPDEFYNPASVFMIAAWK